ncbi:hypothetical protein DPV79_40145 [Burkholderia reimsis]|uniref:Uncharacterized protein n=2 Tax=Burkholderia reimsis TaxID=2234132 RepID=A0A365QGX2_9BURK|nr:hypothetical protein DPV79_40145 [Burkholderia reimsis]
MLAASLIAHSGAIHAEPAGAGIAPLRAGSHGMPALAGIPPDLNALESRLCPLGEAPQSLAIGDVQSWTCGPWTAVSAPEPAADGRPAGWVVSYSGVVRSGGAESLADAEQQCRTANATITRQSATSIECRIASVGTEQIVSYSKSTVTKPHVLFGLNWFETQQDRMTFTVTVRPSVGAVSKG